MIKSILAVSEGGPDAAMSFRLAALYLPANPAVFGASLDLTLCKTPPFPYGP